MTVEELLARISSRELTEWMAYAGISPFGERRADLRAAQICCTLANIHRDPKAKPDPFSPADFMFNFGPQEEQAGKRGGQTVDDLTAQEQVWFLEMFNAAFGGKDLRKK